MKHTKNRIPHLSNDDVKALLVALPLVSISDPGTLEQYHRNQMAVESATNKFLNNNVSFTADEIRVIFVAIGFALDYLSNRCDVPFDPSEIDSEWKSELSKNFFAYSRLYPYFEAVAIEIESQCK